MCVVGQSPAKNCLHQTKVLSKNPPRATTYVKCVCLFFYTRGRPHRLLHILHFSTPSPHRLLHRAFSWERRARGGGEAGGGGGAGKGWRGRGHRKEKIGTGSASIISSRTPRVGLAERGTRTHRSRVEKRVGLILSSKKKLLEGGPGPPPKSGRKRQSRALQCAQKSAGGPQALS